MKFIISIKVWLITVMRCSSNTQAITNIAGSIRTGYPTLNSNHAW